MEKDGHFAEGFREEIHAALYSSASAHRLLSGLPKLTSFLQEIRSKSKGVHLSL